MAHTRTHVIQDPDLLVDQLEDGHLEVRESILDKEGNPTYHRYVLHPGAYAGDKDPRVQVLAQRVHTRDVIGAWEAAEALRKEIEDARTA